VWAPTGQHATLKVLLVHAVSTNLEMRHVDISTAFLYGELEETVYVEQPPELNDGTTNVWRLRKSLYGLKQAGRQWHLRLSQVLREKGFKRAGYDPALYVSESTTGEKQFIFLWVDDLFIVARKEVCDVIAQEVSSTFKGRDLGEASWLLGMKITRDRTRKILELSQARMIENVLERFDMTQCRTSAEPMDLSEQALPDPHKKARIKIEKELSQSESNKERERLMQKLERFKADCTASDKEERTKYMQIVGAVQYLAVVTRPDISFAAASLARYMYRAWLAQRTI
jgi:hypothetical protein